MTHRLQITYTNGESHLEPTPPAGLLDQVIAERRDNPAVAHVDPAVDTVEILRVSDSEWARRTAAGLPALPRPWREVKPGDFDLVDPGFETMRVRTGFDFGAGETTTRVETQLGDIYLPDSVLAHRLAALGWTVNPPRPPEGSAPDTWKPISDVEVESLVGPVPVPAPKPEPVDGSRHPGISRLVWLAERRLGFQKIGRMDLLAAHDHLVGHQLSSIAFDLKSEQDLMRAASKERVECESVSERDLWLREQDRAFAWLGEPGRPSPSEHADACILAARAVARERAELAAAPLDPVPGIDTFTVQIKPTTSDPATRMLVFTSTGPSFLFGKREVSTALCFSTLFAARATQEVGYRFNEFIGPVSRASWDRSGR